MDKKAIEAASKKLELLSVVRVSQLLETDMDRYVTGSVPASEYITQQDRLAAKYRFVEYERDGETFETLDIAVELGTRLVDPSTADENDASDDVSVIATIEAVYHAEYLVIKKRPTDQQAKEFANFNAVHNVWPFWRQYVFDTARAANLPKIIVPLFRGTILSEKQSVSGNE